VKRGNKNFVPLVLFALVAVVTIYLIANNGVGVGQAIERTSQGQLVYDCTPQNSLNIFAETTPPFKIKVASIVQFAELPVQRRESCNMNTNKYVEPYCKRDARGKLRMYIEYGTCDAGCASTKACNRPPTCADRIQNQKEDGVDCGGPCAQVCPSCSDKIQNQGETGVDCGGPCKECPVCNDPDGPDEHQKTTVTITVGGNVVLSQTDYCTIDISSIREMVCGVPNRVDISSLLFSCDPGETCFDGKCVATTCSDGVQNQGEEKIDCGGPCAACAAVASCFDDIQNHGETGVDCGGSNCDGCPVCIDIDNSYNNGIDSPYPANITIKKLDGTSVNPKEILYDQCEGTRLREAICLGNALSSIVVDCSAGKTCQNMGGSIPSGICN